MKVREKVGKSRTTVFFQWFVLRRVKSRLAKAAGAEPAGQMRDEKLHAAVARSKKHLTLGALFEVEMSKKCTPLWRGAKHISKSKYTKHTFLGPLLEVAMSKKCTPLWREAHFEVKMYKAHHARTTFGRSDLSFAWQAQGIVHVVKSEKTWGFCNISKNDGRRGTFEEDLQRCIFRGRRSTRDIFIGAVRRSVWWFPEMGCSLEHQIFRFAKMILRDRRSSSYDLASIFRRRRSTLDRWSGKNNAKRIGTRLSALHSTFHFWRKSRRIALLLMLST